MKRYGSQEAVAGIDLDVWRGEIFAFLGPNGAGKTTTVEMLEGFRQRLRAFLRNRQSQFFTLALPILFLVIFASVFGGKSQTVPVAGGQISTSVYYVPGIMALGVIAACFGNLVASVTAQRERGVLKRRRATPVPAAAIIAGRVLTAIVIAVVMSAVLLGIGWAAYGAHVPGRTALALVVTVVIGAASFCCLGYALTSLIHNEDAALPTTQALLLPLYFISGVCSRPSRSSRTGWPTWERSSPSGTWPTRCSSPTTRTPPGSGSPAWIC